jgi:hypothetical protein
VTIRGDPDEGVSAFDDAGGVEGVEGFDNCGWAVYGVDEFLEPPRPGYSSRRSRIAHSISAPSGNARAC